MASNFIGNTIICVNNPYKIYDEGFHFLNLADFVSKEELDNVVQKSFYDNSLSNRGFTSYFFAKNILESINEDTINKWADFSESYPELFENFLYSVTKEYSNDNEYFQETFYKIPFNDSPIVALSSEGASDYVYGTKNTGKSFNFPDEGIGLFTELAKLKLFDSNSLKKFIKSFGIPLGVNLSDRNVHPDMEDLKKYNTLLYFGAAPTALIYKELVAYQNIFNLFIAVKTNNDKMATKICERKAMFAQGKKIDLYGLNKSKEIELLKEKYKENVLKENPFAIAQCRKYLAKLITEKVSINSKIVETVDGNFTEVKLYSNLFEIAYNQIKDSLISNTELKKCEHCGHFFEPTHGKQRFCNPLPFRKRSSCENSYNQQIKRNKEKALLLYNSGNSIEEISNKINESMQTINEWINLK